MISSNSLPHSSFPLIKLIKSVQLCFWKSHKIKKTLLKINGYTISFTQLKKEMLLKLLTTKKSGEISWKQPKEVGQEGKKSTEDLIMNNYDRFPGQLVLRAIRLLRKNPLAIVRSKRFRLNFSSRRQDQIVMRV